MLELTAATTYPLRLAAGPASWPQVYLVDDQTLVLMMFSGDGYAHKIRS